MINLEQIKTITIVALILVICFLKCNGTTEIIIPEKVVEPVVVKPEVRTIYVTEYKDKLKTEYKYIDKEIKIISDEQAYLEAIADSLAHSNYELSEIIKDYSKVKEFSKEFDDENIKANVSGVLFKNDVHVLKFGYTRKEIKLETPTNKGLYIGGQIGANKDIDDIFYQINLDLLKDNTIYKGSYQKIFGEDYFLVGGSVQLF